jgi:DNA invertase Pin-like site-specific DNA recombinase
VSTADSKSRKNQHVDNQVARLRDAGVPEQLIFADQVSGTKASRPRWDVCLNQLVSGDVLLVTKLDRIGRSLVNVVHVVRSLQDRGVGIRCLDQGDIDTTSPNGKLIFAIMAALAEWESDMARERSVEGREHARARYAAKGQEMPVRKPSITADQLDMARQRITQEGWSAARAAAAIGVSRATLYRHLDIRELRDKAS